MKPFLAGTLALVLACTPSSPSREDDRVQETEMASKPDTSEAEEPGYSPPWAVGQTWGVRYDFSIPSMVSEIDSVPAHEAWRYEVVDITDFGLVRIEARRFNPDRTLSSSSRNRAPFEFHTSGMIVHDFNRWEWESDTLLPFLPYLSTSRAHVPELVPWWPSFPLVPGEESSYFDGALTQSVREEDGVLRVTVVAKERGEDQYPKKTMTMEWERGRPFWTRVAIVRHRDDGTAETPYEIRGRVFSWDQGDTWQHPWYDDEDPSR